MHDPIADKPSFVSRRRFLSSAAKAMVAAPLFSVPLLQSCGKGGNFGFREEVRPFQGPDAVLLDEIERTAFQFFWDQGYPTTGLVKDRTHARDSDSYFGCSIAAVGYALAALCIGDARNYRPSRQIRERVKTTLSTFAKNVESHEGFFYHFLNWTNGQRIWNSELSSIDTAIFICGALTARQYFGTDYEIVDLATQLYNNVNWPWMCDGAMTVSMGWKPDSGFINARWSHYCELMMIYLLGIGSPTHPLPPESWNAWSRATYTYEGVTYISSGDPLFTHQYSHAWYDFRNKHDDYADYFQNSVKATLAHKKFCLSLRDRFPDYSDSLWGFTASDAIDGYVAWGGPPAHGPIDGSVVPCATGGSLPFLYNDCMQVLRNIRGTYPQAWSRYGYTDAFNPLKKWYNADVLGIDQGIMMVMIENQRTGLVWNNFMKNVETQKAMQLAGFVPNSA